MCNVCKIVGIKPIHPCHGKESYISRLSKTLRSRHHEGIFEHVLGPGPKIIDLDEAAENLQARDYEALFKFKGEKIGPFFLPEVWLSKCPQVVREFDEEFDLVKERFGELYEELETKFHLVSNELSNDFKEDLQNRLKNSRLWLSIASLTQDFDKEFENYVDEIDKELKKHGMTLDGFDKFKEQSDELNKRRAVIRRAKSDFVEKMVFDMLKPYLVDHNVTCFVVTGLELFKLTGKKGQDQFELDILIVDYDRQIICNIEVKSKFLKASASQAEKQLKRNRETLCDYFDSELKGEWRFVSCIFCTSIEKSEEKKVQLCSDADMYVFSAEDDDFLEKFENMMSDAGKGQIPTPEHQEDYSKLTRYLSYLMCKKEQPTPNIIHDEIRKKVEEGGSIENIMYFATPQQQTVIKNLEERSEYKVALFGAWGTGKTMIMKHCAMQLAKKGEKVLFLVAQDAKYYFGCVPDVKTQLILELEETFKDFRDLITVKPLLVENGEPIYIEEVTKGYKTVFLDEFFDDFLLLSEWERHKEWMVDDLKSKDRVLMAFSNSLFQEDISYQLSPQADIKSFIAKKWPAFRTILLDTPLRQPKNIAEEVQEECRFFAKTFNHRLVAAAKLPKNLNQGLPTLTFGAGDLQSLFTLLPKAFQKTSNKALIIINDHASTTSEAINNEIDNKIHCKCKDIFYLAYDVALQQSGRPKQPLWQTLRRQSNEDDNKAWISGRRRNCDYVLSVSLANGCQSDLIMNETYASNKIQSRAAVQYICLEHDFFFSLYGLAHALNTTIHDCDTIFDWTKRPPLTIMNVQQLTGKVLNTFEKYH